MRAIFSIVSLLVALAIVALLAKKQLGGGTGPTSARTAQEAGVTLPVASPGATPQAQSLQIQQDVKQKLDASLQARPMPEADKP